MKKSLIALAAVAAVGAASAQSSVSIYGIVDASYGQITATAAGVKSTNAGISSQQSVSRIGLKGTEDMGGGLKANFTLEYYIEPDNGSGIGAGTASTTASTARQAFFGVEGGFGSINIGNQTTLIALVNGTSDFHGGVNTVGYNNSNNQNSRRSNMVQYVSPTTGGFAVSAQVGFAGALTANTGNNTAIRATYTNGPIVVAAATEYTTLTKLTTANLGATLPGTDFANGTRTTDLSDALATRKRTAYGSTYDLGVATVGFTRSQATAGSSASAGSFSNTSFGVTVPMGMLKLNATVDSGNFVKSGVSANTRHYQLSSSYALSKRTNLYAILGNATNRTTASTSDAQYAIGLRHSF